MSEGRLRSLPLLHGWLRAPLFVYGSLSHRRLVISYPKAGRAS